MQRHRLKNRLLGTALVLAGALGMLPGAAALAADQPALQAIDVQPLAGQQLQLTMRLSAPPQQPMSFTIDNPARISFDLPSTTLALPSRRIDVHAAGLENILAAETKDRTRVVLNLDKLVPYDTKVVGNNIIVTLGVTGDLAQAAGAGASPLQPEPRCGQQRARTALDRLPAQRRRRGPRDREALRSAHAHQPAPGRQRDRRRLQRRWRADEPRAPLRRDRFRHPGEPRST